MLLWGPGKETPSGDIENISFGDGMAIIGSHCLGPAVSKVFKISFDKY